MARDALHGVWLGHPLHPVLVQAPAGTWLSASLLDAWPGNEKASRRLVLAGLAAAGLGGFLGGHRSRCSAPGSPAMVQVLLPGAG